MKNKEEIKELLIVVDMINGFVKEGALADPYINHIVLGLKRLIEYYKKNNGVAFIQDTHKSDCPEFKKFPPHCLEGTRESEIIDELKPYVNGSYIYNKNSRSTLFAKGFISDLEKMKNLKKVVVTGCCTDLCVLDLAIPLVNYFDEINRDTQVVVPMDLVETYDACGHNREEYNNMAFKLMEQEGVKLERTLRRYYE